MMQKSALVGAILAAGKGSRMAPFNDKYPKPLMPICNQPLIEYQISIMKSVGIKEVVILIGYKGYEIAQTLGDGSRLGIRVQYVEQTELLGIGHAVGLLEPYISGPFLLMLGDIFFVARNIQSMVDLYNAQGEGGVLAVKEESDPAVIQKNFSVTGSPEGLVTRVVEKPRRPPSRLKGVGLYLFDEVIFDAIRRTPRTAMRNEYELTESIQVMINDGWPVRASQSIEEDINLTFPSDLLNCNLLVARQRTGSHLVHSTADINPLASVEDSVIGSNVKVQHPIQIRRSLILDDSIIETSADLDGFIVSSDTIVDCKHYSIV